jgi:hypothetical protein
MSLRAANNLLAKVLRVARLSEASARGSSRIVFSG